MVAIYVDVVACEHSCKANVQATLTDSERHLLGTQEHLGVLVLLIESDRRDFGRAECALNEELRIACVVDHVDVLVAQLADDAVNACTLHTNARSNGVDAVVVALDGDFGTFTRDSCNGADKNQSVVDFGRDTVILGLLFLLATL